MKVSWDYDIPKKWKNKKCSKPPTSIGNPTNPHAPYMVDLPTSIRVVKLGPFGRCQVDIMERIRQTWNKCGV